MTWKSYLKCVIYSLYLCKLALCERERISLHNLPKSDFIEFLNPPDEPEDGYPLGILYHCSQEAIVNVEVIASTEQKTAVSVFKKRWMCTSGSAAKVREVQIDFPDQIVFRDDYFLKHSVLVLSIMLRAWIADVSSEESLPSADAGGGSYMQGLAKTFHILQPVTPFSRPLRPPKQTLRWDHEILWKLQENTIPQCRVEEETVHFLKFIFASSGERFGIIKKVSPYSYGPLERTRQRSTNFPRSTFSAWLYLLSYCESTYCSILHHLDWSKNYSTPVLHVIDTGALHVQVELVSKRAEAFRTTFTIPLHQWCLLNLDLRGKEMNVTVVCGSKKTMFNTVHTFEEAVLLDDTDGHFVLGGSPFVLGAKAFFGPAVFYRNRKLPPFQISDVIPPDPIDRLNLSDWFDKCYAFRRDVLLKKQAYQYQTSQRLRQKACPNLFSNYVKEYNNVTLHKFQCFPWDAPFPRRRATVYRLLQEMIRRLGNNINIAYQTDDKMLEFLGKTLYKRFERQLKHSESLSHIRVLLPQLLQAGCLGFHRAFYLVSVLYQTGLGALMKPEKALHFGLLAAQKDDHLALMRLGHKHYLGVDEFPTDYDVAYAYYANIAEQTTVDRQDPSPEQAFVESIRLTDEKALKEQTKENDDLFLWLKFQAKKGVAEAQQALGRMLFWGQQGVTHNLQAAVKFYEKGAMKLQDPTMMYDYAVVLLKGQGVPQDIPKAVELLEKAAEQDFVPAINALGWYYETYKKDYKRAVEYWEKADEMENAEAPLNLGVICSLGLYPGKPKDDFIVYSYYWKSAHRGHIDGAVRLAEYWSTGVHGKVARVPLYAIVWAKWASEQNGYLGAVLRRALNAYLEHSWPEALVNYAMAAETGFEVSQFNMAYLCEQIPEGLVSRHMHTSCIWKYYNLSTHVEYPNTYALVKMGDLFYYGQHEKKRDLGSAVAMYKAAALKNDPQGYYSLGFLVQEGVSLPLSTLNELGLESDARRNNYTILMELYRRCRDNEEEESYLVCSLALLNVQLKYIWIHHSATLKYSGAIGIALISTMTVLTALGRFRNGVLNFPQSV
ncbi:protein sel-1 homolog 3-like [Protopterus annectens]|uniref:protein sel-1 homolog 3-like n=1 Tax=Protopterus annectens TaxID=7888 RepID=UPI001CFAEA1E|nr:protein sel-1 homolog 3-like [Protopterus annectens]